MKKYKIKEDSKIDTFSIAFYAEDELEDSTLIVLRNKKMVNNFNGIEAIKLYNFLLKGK